MEQARICARCGGFARCYKIKSPFTGRVIFLCFRCVEKHIIIKDYFDVI